MLNKEQKKQIQEVQQAAARLQEMISDSLEIQNDVAATMEEKTEAMQEKFYERHPWLDDFLNFDLSNLESELEVFSSLELE